MNVGTAGSYKEVIQMNSDGTCKRRAKPFSGPLSPLDEEVREFLQVEEKRKANQYQLAGFFALPGSNSSKATGCVYSLSSQEENSSCPGPRKP